jgi:hypothetical protein
MLSQNEGEMSFRTICWPGRRVARCPLRRCPRFREFYSRINTCRLRGQRLLVP